MADIVDGLFESTEGSEPTPEPIVTPEPISAEPAPVEQAQPEPEPAPVAQPEPQAPPPGFIPLAAVLDEREKRKDLERQLAEIRSQQNHQPQQAPSFYDDPEAFAAYQQEQFAGIERNIRFSTSERFAVQAHGSEVVEQAKEWSLSQDPYTIAKIRDSQDPIGEAVAQYQRSQMVSDPDAWFAQEAAKRGYQQAASAGAVQQAAPIQQPVTRAPPPRSLVNAPSSGGLSQIPEGGAFESIKFPLG